MGEDEGAKRHVAARVPPDLAAEIERLQNAGERSQSEAVRVLLRRGLEADRLQREHDSLQNQLNTLAGREREHGELAEYVEREKTIQEQRQKRQNAPVWRRFLLQTGTDWSTLGAMVLGGVISGLVGIAAMNYRIWCEGQTEKKDWYERVAQRIEYTSRSIEGWHEELRFGDTAGAVGSTGEAFSDLISELEALQRDSPPSVDAEMLERLMTHGNTATS